MSESMEINLAYSHIFFEGGKIDREAEVASSSGLGVSEARLYGDANQSADIISVGLKHKFGGGEAPLK